MIFVRANYIPKEKRKRIRSTTDEIFWLVDVHYRMKAIKSYTVTIFSFDLISFRDTFPVHELSAFYRLFFVSNFL